MNEFTTIGIFYNVENSQNAAITLKKMLAEIAHWHTAHPFKSEKLFNKEMTALEPSPPEKTFATHYDVRWEDGQDWLLLDDPDLAAEYVTQYKTMAFISAGETNNSGQPFDAILLKLGAQETYLDNDAQTVLADVTCSAPSEAIAIKIYDLLNIYLHNEGASSSPWMLYPGGERLEDAADLLTLEPVYMQHLESLNMLDSHPDLAEFSQVIAGEVSNSALVARYEQRRDHLIREILASLPELDEDDATWIDDLREEVELAFSEGGDLKREGLILSLSGIEFNNLAVGLPALLEWLEAQGCTQVKLALHQEI